MLNPEQLPPIVEMGCKRLIQARWLLASRRDLSPAQQISLMESIEALKKSIITAANIVVAWRAKRLQQLN